MKESSSETLSHEEAEKHPLQRSPRSRGSLTFLSCYFLIGLGSLFIVAEIVHSGLWLEVGVPCLAIWLGLTGLSAARQREQARLTKRST